MRHGMGRSGMGWRLGFWGWRGMNWLDWLSRGFGCLLNFGLTELLRLRSRRRRCLRRRWNRVGRDAPGRGGRLDGSGWLLPGLARISHRRLWGRSRLNCCCKGSRHSGWQSGARLGRHGSGGSLVN